MTDDKTKKRNMPEANALREAAAAIRPFVGRFEDWNHRAARAGGAIRSHALSDAEKDSYRNDLRALQNEVSIAHSEFVTATIQLPKHSRIDDIEAAFQRLLKILRAASTLK